MTNQINASLLCLFQSNKGRATDGFALVYSKLRPKFPTLHAQKPRQCKLPEAEIVHRFLFTFSAFFGFLRFYFFFFFFLLHFVINTVPFAVTVYYLQFPAFCVLQDNHTNYTLAEKKKISSTQEIPHNSTAQCNR